MSVTLGSGPSANICRCCEFGAHTACSLPLAAWPVAAMKSLNKAGAWYKPAAVIKQAHFPFP